MKRFLYLVAAAAFLFAGTARAQDEEPIAEDTVEGGSFLRPPVFLLMPGALTTNVISAPEGIDSHTEFNARFMTVIPTATPWFSLVGGVQWAVRQEAQAHPPIVFYGAIFNIAPLTNLTNGLLAFSIDPLGVTTPGAEGGTTTDFFLEGAVVFNIGALIATNSPFKGASIYFLVDQNITPDDPPGGGDPDRFNPVLLYGIALPIAPWGP